MGTRRCPSFSTPVSDIIVIVDVLSFTTCVDVVLSRGGIVYPYRYTDASGAAEFALKLEATLAGKRGEPISLSPTCLSTAPIFIVFIATFPTCPVLIFPVVQWHLI